MLSELAISKKRAEQEDDFDRLVALRDAMMLVKEKGRNYKNLKDMKTLAVENEDYEVAKKIKI